MSGLVDVIFPKCGVQVALNIGALPLDVSKLVVFNPNPHGQRWRSASGDFRRGVEGVAIGTICLKHASGYEVVLQMDDGSIDSFAPMSLFPVVTVA